MNNTGGETSNWFAYEDIHTDQPVSDVWESGFDGDRQLVMSKIIAHKKLFLRPKKFRKRFYHTLIPLAIEEWQCLHQLKLYDDFCTLDIALTIRFQATLEYAYSNMDVLTALNSHIKTTHHSLVLDIVDRELLDLSDGSWVQEGLRPMEKKIAVLIAEMLVVRHIQSHVICRLKPSFAQFPRAQFAKENAYLHVLKKSFEIEQQQHEEVFRQQQQQEKQKIEHKRKHLKYINEAAELQRQKQALHAENTKRLLEYKASQQLNEYQVRKKIHLDKINHQHHLTELSLLKDLQEKDQRRVLIKKNEAQESDDLIAHRMQLKEKKLDAEIAEYTKKQADWRDARSKVHAKQLDQNNKRRQLEFDAKSAYERRYELQRIAIQEENYAVKKDANLYLKREIELLELEKKRLALQLTIKRYKDQGKLDTP